jgi:hypothetical protein
VSHGYPVDKVKITGPDGVPVTASGPVDNHALAVSNAELTSAVKELVVELQELKVLIQAIASQ